jgi:hypothetical protein
LTWGYQSERLQADVYLLLQKVLASITMLVGTFYVYGISVLFVSYYSLSLTFYSSFFVLV